MSSPLAGDVHVNKPLSQISIAYMQSQDNFVADKVFPNIPVDFKSDRYYTYDRGEFNRDEMQERAPATQSVGGGYTLDNTPTYYCRVYAFHKDVDDQMRANADSMLNVEREATNYVSMKALLKREKLFIQRFMGPGIWSFDARGTSDGTAGNGGVGITTRRWDDHASDPIATIRTAKRAGVESTGMEFNTLVLSRAAYDALLDHPDILDRLKYGQTAGAPAQTSKANLADLFGINRILVMSAIENIAPEGQKAQHRFISGRNALLCYAAPAPGLMTASAGYTFSWKGFMGASAMGGRIKTFRMEEIESDRIEIQMAFDQKVVAADLGFYFNDIVTQASDPNLGDPTATNFVI